MEDNYQHLSSPPTLDIVAWIFIKVERRNTEERQMKLEEMRAKFKQVRVTDGQDGDTCTRSVGQGLPTLSPQKDSLTRRKLYTVGSAVIT